MKKIMLVCGIWLLVSHSVKAQDEEGMGRKEGREKIETARIGFLTTRLNLTSDQASKFWPIYNEYTNKRQEIRKSIHKFKFDAVATTTNDQELLASLKERMNLRQKEVDLEKEYMNKLLKVLSPRQLVDLYKSEQAFKEELLKTLQDRRANRKSER